MHFAFPPRKSSHPPPYALRSNRLSHNLRRSRIRTLALIGLGIFAFFYLISGLLGSGKESIPARTPPVVIVTTITKKVDKTHSDRVKQNRIDYAKKHGYDVFMPDSNSYNLGKQPNSWSKIPATRHAMALFPHTTYFWYLSEHALIMNSELSVEEHIMNPAQLESLMIPNIPVVPPDSVIKTFSHNKASDVDLVLSQDHDGLSQNSFILRRGEWARFFLDSWFDPLYRSYNFQKADLHALEHLVQWHGSVLSKLALIDQRTFNSYTQEKSKGKKAGLYSEGDFVANFFGCDNGKRSCVEEMEPYFEMIKAGRNKEIDM